LLLDIVAQWRSKEWRKSHGGYTKQHSCAQKEDKNSGKATRGNNKDGKADQVRNRISNIVLEFACDDPNRLHLLAI
jgi:hypothetical protein